MSGWNGSRYSREALCVTVGEVQSIGALAVPFGLMAKQKAGWKQPEPGISDHSMNWMHIRRHVSHVLIPWRNTGGRSNDDVDLPSA